MMLSCQYEPNSKGFQNFLDFFATKYRGGSEGNRPRTNKKIGYFVFIVSSEELVIGVAQREEYSQNLCLDWKSKSVMCSHQSLFYSSLIAIK